MAYHRANLRNMSEVFQTDTNHKGDAQNLLAESIFLSSRVVMDYVLP